MNWNDNVKTKDGHNKELEKFILDFVDLSDLESQISTMKAAISSINNNIIVRQGSYTYDDGPTSSFDVYLPIPHESQYRNGYLVYASIVIADAVETYGYVVGVIWPDTSECVVISSDVIGDLNEIKLYYESTGEIDILVVFKNDTYYETCEYKVILMNGGVKHVE